ncbi:MAG TPA: 2-hydroxychromene-2-carboxylate isomerase [Candidatus Binataceae bacterium]|nr:2-hydroxychromene-2-carboxylate isomerase [Candidatus Binataceae bacterium]
MAKTIEFFFDYGSPFSYLAHIQLPGFAKRNGATVVYRPILLGAVLKATANSSPMSVPAKARYMGTELKRWAARYGVRFALNPHPFLGNTLALMRGAVAARHLGAFPAYNEAIFRAIWAEGLDLGNPAVLAGVTHRAGLDPAGLAANSDRPEIKDELRRNTDEAVARGAFGAPTIFVGDEMFWGNDRFDFVEEALRKSG